MKKKILAIDDSKAMRFLLQTVLGKDFQVITAPDGCTAMFWLSKNIPDLIITDAQLPDMNDWELIEELSSSVLYRDIPVMVISSLDKTVTKIKCEEFGVAEFFMKPFNPVMVLEEINKLTGGQKITGQQKASLS